MIMDGEIRKGYFPNVQKFCEMFEVKKRTVLEDIKVMKEGLGLEITYDRFHAGYYNANPKKELPSFQLTEGEIFALTLGKEMLSQYTGTSFEPILRSALDKIRERLPDRIDVDLDEVRSLIRFNAGPVIPISRKLFLELNQACEKTKSAHLEYYSASKDETTSRKVDPYRLLEYRSTWYLVAYCHLRKDMRLFAIHRIKDYSLTEEKFAAREGVDIDRWLDSAFQLEHGDAEHRVKIRFAPASARYVRERQWHHTQELTDSEDGGCFLSFTTQSLEEAKRWVLTYGREAEVLEPAEFRNMMQTEIRAAASLYGSESSLSTSRLNER
jgi:predicted DNA-binding transcriptional regulator YafY